MILQTERLILRHWEESDAEDLYEYAKDPDVGTPAGWPFHRSVDESREIIRTVFSGAEAYAVCLKADNRAIGAIELMLNGHTDLTERDDECELGYWIGKPFWGQGLIPEAAEELLRRAFEELGMKKVWCAYYDGNTKSKRVQEKLGFRYQWTAEGVDVPLLQEKRTGHVNCLTKEEWRNSMKTAIIYYSRHHGNTKKVIDALAAGSECEITEIDAAAVKSADLSEYDLIGFASGIYYSKFHKTVLEFAEQNLPQGKKVFFLYTCGADKKGYTNAIREAAAKCGAQIVGEYGCRGFDTFGPFKLIGGIAKGHPNEEELSKAVKFFRGLM